MPVPADEFAMVIVAEPVMAPVTEMLLLPAAIVSRVKLLFNAMGPVKVMFPVPFCMVRVPVPATIVQTFVAVPVPKPITTFSEPPTLPKVIVPVPVLAWVEAYKKPALTRIPPAKVLERPLNVS